MKTFKELLIELDACEPSITWAEDKTIDEVVRTCNRGDWLLWLAYKIELPLKILTLAKARCAKTVIHLMKDQRSIDAVNIAERFGLDECTLDELKASAASASAAYASSAADAASAAASAASASAAYAAYASAAAYTASAAASAASASAAYAAYASAAAYTAYASADAASAASAAKTKNLKQTADICREILGELIIEKVNAKIHH